jgi:tetratricopeptide (TPR) repeat protein
MYCSKPCQVLDWKAGHKTECGRIIKHNKECHLSDLTRNSWKQMCAGGVDGGSIVDNGLKAIEQLEQAKALAEEMDNKESLWVSTFNLAVTIMGLGQIEKSVALFKQCLVVSKRKGYRKLCPHWTLDEAIVHRFLGNCLMILGKYEQALESLQESRTLYNSWPKEKSSLTDLHHSSPDLVGTCCRYIHSHCLSVCLYCIHAHCLSVCVYFSCTMPSGRLLGRYAEAVAFHQQALVQCQQIAKLQEVCLVT